MAKLSTAQYLDLWAAQGAPLTALVAHGIHSLNWLAERADETFRLAYTGRDGSQAIETMSAAGMLVRGSELGWTPMISEAPGQFLCFEEAVYCLHRGVHWYATEYEEETGLPLALPERVREAARRRDRAYKARLDRKVARERQAREREQARRQRDEDAKLIASLADDAELRAARAGRPISRRTAEKRGKKLWRDLMEGIASELAKLRAARGVPQP